MIEKRKLEHSEYILGVRKRAREIADALTERYGYASILVMDATGKSYRCDRSGVSAADEPLYCSRGAVIRVIVRGSVLELALDDIENAQTESICERIDRMSASMPDGDIDAGESECILSESTEYLLSPEEMGDERILSRLSEQRERALRLDARVFDALVRLSWQKYTKLFISPARDMTESVMWTAATVLTFVREGERMKDSYRGYSNLGGIEILDKLADEGIELSVRSAVDLLSSEPIPAGEYDCVCSPDVTGLIVHEAFGHGVEMDMFVRDRALAREYVGKRVASDLVSMHDTASAVNEAASYFFDDEGNLSSDTLIIDRGILVQGIADGVAAARLGVSPTGNGRRENFAHKAYTRMTNTYFEPGTDTLEDMIASIDYGFYIEEARCGMEDPKNWGIQCVAGIAREIRAGVLTGKVYSPVVMSGYVPLLLQSISMMSGESSLFGCGFCGKGYKEWVKVSDGGPAIKARIKLS